MWQRNSSKNIIDVLNEIHMGINKSLKKYKYQCLHHYKGIV